MCVRVPIPDNPKGYLMVTKRIPELLALVLPLLLLVLAAYGFSNSPISIPAATMSQPPVVTVTVSSRLVVACEGAVCNGADPDYAQCAYDHHVERQATIDVPDEHGFAIAELQLVGAPRGRCGAVQWARVDKRIGIQTFALRIVRCDGVASAWRMPSDYSEPAWSDMLSSPRQCAWAEYGLRDSQAPAGWRAVAWVKAP